MINRLWRILLVVVLVVSLLRPGLVAAQNAPSRECPDEQKRAFTFLIGSWEGRAYDLKGADSTASGATARVTAAPLFAGCALHEEWHFEDNGKPEVDDDVLRAFDNASGTWAYDLVTSWVEHVRFEGRRVGGGWSFERDVDSPSGQFRIRLMWVPTAFGYSEQIARSTDRGQTWTETRHINFRRAR